MPQKKQPKIQELAATFLDTPILYHEYDGGDEAREVVIKPKSSLLYHEGDQSFYYYEDGCWHIIPEADAKTGPVARMLSHYLQANFPEVNITTSAVAEVRAAIAKFIPRRFMATKPSPYTAFRDKLINFRTFEFEDFSPGKMAFHKLDFNTDQLAMPTPVFDAYLARAFPDDPAMQEFIPEMIGYYLLPRTDEPAAFFLYGAARSGKSVMLDLITAMLGEKFVSAFSLQSLTTDKYTTAELAGKRANIIDEDESEYIQPGKLKALISNAPMQAERKYAQPFTFKPETKFLFSSNQFPKFKSVDDGLKRRLNFIEFKHPLTKAEQDKTLPAKLRAELPGIVGKCINAAREFMRRNQEFNLPKSIEETNAVFVAESMPPVTFFYETYKVVPADMKNTPATGRFAPWTSNETIYSAYEEWATKNGKGQKNALDFHKILHAHIPGLVSHHFGNVRYKNCVRMLNQNGDGMPKPEAQPMEDFHP